MGQRISWAFEQLRYSGGRVVRTGRARLVEVPLGGVVVSGSWRVLEVGDEFTAADGVLTLIPDAAWASFLRPGFAMWSASSVLRFLLPVARALFGWLS